MRLRRRTSPNHGPRRPSTRIDMLVIHYTGMASTAAALDRLCDPAAAVSAHYLIDEDGTTWRLVDEGRRAWHAGRSFWAGETDINSASIGIELVNPGHEFGYRPFPAAQMDALVALARRILRRHAIPGTRVLGHSDVAPQRKDDPGELFDWPGLAAAGIGLWPNFPAIASGAALPPDASADAARGLAAIGYEPARDGESFGRLLRAFQRHWRPRSCDGRLDAETLARIDIVASASRRAALDPGSAR